ncbi:hybrid sensor histidine kinase/response regulator [Desulfatitalea alkaliphila]|uniref:histidine kinase n=1 Tax=Desulfatitalea alkaliphila TaxID=2929485 RepID=A0AA41UK28_9BACT|nr:PAS domain-containing sensor histidine kinase [Desulfatitalea alkaliphila]MCJ8499951.1 PAS domain S-box protein [Desulfatitalea alkaliphila]
MTAALPPGSPAPSGSDGGNVSGIESKLPVRRHHPSEAHFHRMLALIRASYFESDLAGRLTFFNEYVTRLHGRSAETLRQLRPKDFLAPDDVQRVYEMFETVYRTGNPSPVMEYQIIDADGRRVSVETATSLLRDDEGTPIGFCGISRDITERKRTEKALRDSESKHRGIIENMEEGYYETDPTGQLTYFNDTSARNLGYSREEMMGLSYRDFMTPDTAAKTFEVFNAVHQSGQPAKVYACELIRKDGSRSFQEISVSLTRNAAGEPTGFFGIARDRTEALQMERDLAEREAGYRQILSCAPYSITVTRQSDARYLEANDAFCTRTGYSREEVIGATATELDLYTDPADRARIMNTFNLQGGVDGMEVTFKSRNGDPLETLVAARPLRFRGEDCILFITTEITALKRAQRELAKSEQRFRTIVESAQDAIFLKDESLRYTLVNPVMEKLFGLAAEAFIGRTNEEVFHPEDVAAVKRSEQRVLQGRIVEEDERWRIGSRPRIFHSIKVPLVDHDGRITGLCGFTRDMTATRNLEAQLLQAQKMEAIGILAGGISHDFNNLLQAIIGYTQLLIAETPSPDPRAGKLRAIENAARRASELTGQLLAFSRKAESHPLPTDLNQAVRQVKKLLERTIPKMIAIRLDLAEPIMTVNADAVQLEQVLLNIGLNARDAMPEGGCLTFTTANIQPEHNFRRIHLDETIQDYVLLSISDTGHGMTPEVKQHMFEPFFTTKQKGHGTGLGMAMAYGLIKNHRGHINCESVPGQGTTFNIYLPAIKEPVPPPREEIEPAIARGRGETVLVVDDELFLRDLTRDMLSLHGYDVLLAESGEAGLALFKAHKERIALVILDLIMPGMGGKQCLVEIMKIDPRTKVLIASGFAMDAPTGDTILSKAAGFIQKPYNMAKLLQTLNEVMGQKPSDDG